MRSLLPTTPEGASRGAELVTADGRALALVSTRLRGTAGGGLARLVLEQRFENPYDEALHVTYRMPLPAGGAISGYAFELGDRVVEGVVDRKAAARERFERAIVEGRTAALLEQERADIFTQQLGNLPPREALVARIAIDQPLAWLPEGEWELRFPTVIGPRYLGAADTPADAAATHVKVTDRPLEVRLQIELAIRDAIPGGALPSSPSHALERQADGTIALRSASRLDRDLVVRWRVATPEVGLALAAARPPAGDDAYGLLTIVPPARDAHPVAVPRDLIVLLDTSGSMAGGPLAKAKQVVGMLIDSLAEQDRLELIEFASAPSRYAAEPVIATARAKQDAIRWVRSRQASGGTEMRAAVIEALTTLRVGAQRQVVVVTDGYVGGERQILEALHRGLPASCRLHVLGVGSAVNRSLATSLARAGRGTEVLVGLDEDAERAAKRLLDRTRLPIVTNLEIAGSALLRHAPERLPDVFEGAPLVAALALRAEGGELVVRGQLAREAWEQRLSVAPLRPGDGDQAIVALYGRERVADVEARAMFDTVDGEIEDLGLTFQIATRRTSWVAVDELRRATGPTRSQLIPQELPYGTSAEAFGLRAPAAASPLGGAMTLELLESSPAEMQRARRMRSAPRREVDDDEVGGPVFSDLDEACISLPFDGDAFGEEEATGEHEQALAKESSAKLELAFDDGGDGPSEVPARARTRDTARETAKQLAPPRPAAAAPLPIPPPPAEVPPAPEPEPVLVPAPAPDLATRSAPVAPAPAARARPRSAWWLYLLALILAALLLAWLLR